MALHIYVPFSLLFSWKLVPSCLLDSFFILLEYVPV